MLLSSWPMLLLMRQERDGWAEFSFSYVLVKRLYSRIEDPMLMGAGACGLPCLCLSVSKQA